MCDLLTNKSAHRTIWALLLLLLPFSVNSEDIRVKKYTFRYEDTFSEVNKDYVTFYLKMAEQSPMFIKAFQSNIAQVFISDFSIQEIILKEDAISFSPLKSPQLNETGVPVVVNQYDRKSKGSILVLVWKPRFQQLLTNGDSRLVRISLSAFYSDSEGFKYAYELLSEPFLISLNANVLTLAGLDSLKEEVPNYVFQEFDFSEQELSVFEEKCRRIQINQNWFDN